MFHFGELFSAKQHNFEYVTLRCGDAIVFFYVADNPHILSICMIDKSDSFGFAGAVNGTIILC